jgi:hypothetical protein
LKLAFPRPGEVLRYAYLWHIEQARGHEEAAKDRPCVVIVASVKSKRVWVLPITHVPPSSETGAIDLPAETKKRLRLDDAESWVVTDELNEFLWPGPDLRPIPGKQPKTVVYGLLPASYYEKLREDVRKRVEAQAVQVVSRSQ